MPPLVVGTLAIDTIELPGRTVTDSFGGSASFSTLAASLFGPVRLVAGIGDDLPPVFRQLLTEHGVDMAGVVTYPGQTCFRWHGRYQNDLNCRHTAAMHLGVLEHYEPEVPNEYRDSRLVLIANMPPAKQLRVISQLSNSPFIMLDTVDDWIIAHREELVAVLGHVDAALMNDAEIRLLTGADNLYRAGRLAFAFGPKMVIVKKGDHGCILFDRDGVTVLPAYPTENVIDPTGAGDSFAGGILGYLSGQPEITPQAIRRALCYGAVIASLTVEGDGLNRLRQATRDEADERFEQYRAMLTVE